MIPVIIPLILASTVFGNVINVYTSQEILDK